VVSARNGARWDHYYHEDKEEQKKRRRLEQLDAREELATVKANMPLVVEDQVAKMSNALLPTMMQSISNWIKGGQQGPLPIPNLRASNSTNEALVNAPDVNTDAPTPAVVANDALPVNAKAPITAELANAPVLNAKAPTPVDVARTPAVVAKASTPTPTTRTPTMNAKAPTTAELANAPILNAKAPTVGFVA
jgi:hypothetical protein